MKKVEHKIKLGQKVKDIVSGFEGIATARATALNGCIQYAIKPMYLNKDGKVPNAETIDQQQLEIVDEKPIARVRPKKLKFELGDKLEHIITGFHGTATLVIEHISGGIEYGIKPMMKPGDKEAPDALGLNQEVLALKKEEKPIKVKKKPTGGVIQDLKSINLC